MLDEEIRRPDYGPDWVHTRGSVLQRVFSHDVYHSSKRLIEFDEETRTVVLSPSGAAAAEAIIKKVRTVV